VRITLVLFLALAACAPHTPPNQAPTQPGVAATAPIVRGEAGPLVDDYLRRLEAYGMAGSILVALGDEVVLQQGYGLANRAAAVPIGPDTPFVIGSLSKQFTAAAVVKLEAQGKLSIDERLERFFPDAPADKRGITVAQLLSHSSGLPYLTDRDMMGEAPRPEMMGEMLGLPLVFAPGTQYSYSSPGYSLLAGVIEAASGRTFERYVAEELFAPAGMTATGFMGEPRWDAAPTHSYSGNFDEGPMRDFGRMDRGVGAGTVITTPGDLWKWVQALRKDSVLPASAREKLWTAHIPMGQPNMSHGYGWNVIDTPRGTIVGHGGDLGGYNADCRIYIERDMVLIFESNGRPSGPGYRDAVVNNVSLLLGGDPHPEPPSVQDVDAAALAGHAGTYTLPSGGHVEVRVEGARAQISADSQAGIALLAGASAGEGLAAELSATTAVVADATARKDYAPMQANLHASLPFGGMQAELDATIDELAARLGPYQGTDVLGTAVVSPRSARTYFRLRFERGADIGAYGWVGGKIMAIEGELGRAGETVFAPESADVLAAYDLFTGRAVRATFVRDAAGKTVAVRFSGPGGEVEARRG
jgi:CubicO group peptidase (beta-lactamase class C family)